MKPLPVPQKVPCLFRVGKICFCCWAEKCFKLTADFKAYGHTLYQFMTVLWSIRGGFIGGGCNGCRGGEELFGQRVILIFNNLGHY